MPPCVLPSRRRALAAGAALACAPAGGYGADAPRDESLRVCFFTDAHLPVGNSVARLTDDKYHHQKRVRVAFDRANAYRPAVFVFGGDNVFAVDQSVDGGDKEDNARAQFANWKAVVKEKVSGPHHSVIGNHDIWHAAPKGTDPKALAVEAFGMSHRYYAWEQGGWKFLMLDVFAVTGAPVDKDQLAWVEKETDTDRPVCVVSHAPIFSVTTALVGGGVKSPKVFRDLFLKRPNVRLALSGHNHLVDACVLDRVTYICGGAVCGSWWEGDYHHVPPAFVVLDLEPTGAVRHEVVYWEKRPLPAPAAPAPRPVTT